MIKKRCFEEVLNEMCKPAIAFMKKKRLADVQFNVFQIEQKKKDILETKQELQIAQATYLELLKNKLELLQKIMEIKSGSHQRDCVEHLLYKYKLCETKAK